MPYAVPAGAILEAVIRMTMNGQTLLGTFHYKFNQVGGTADGDAQLSTFLAEFNGAGGLVDQIAGATVAPLSFFDVSAQWIFPTRYRRKVEGPVVETGALAGAPLPQNVAISFTKRGDQAGRHFHGSFHMPGIQAADVSDGLVLNAATPHLFPVANKIKAGVLGVGFTPVLFNRANPANSAAITDVTWEKTVRVMRRRTVGVGK